MGRTGVECWLFLGAAVLTACSSKGATSSRDAATHSDATAEVDGAVEGGSSGGGLDSSALEGAVDSSIPTRPDGSTHPNKCTGPLNCGSGEICCDALGSLVVDSTCNEGPACPSGFVQVCGATGGESCGAAGSCREYLCTYGAHDITATIYACSIPIMTDVTCARVPDAGFGTTGDAALVEDAGP